MSNIELTEKLLPNAEVKQNTRDKAASLFLTQYTYEDTKSFYDQRRSVLKNLCFFVFILIPFWQVPFWCSKDAYESNECGSSTSGGSTLTYNLSGITYIKPEQLLIFELVLNLLIMWCLSKKQAKDDEFNYHAYVVYPLMAFSLIDTAASVGLGYFTYHNYFASSLRPIAFIVNSKVLRVMVWNIIRILVGARRMLAYLAMNILFFAWIARLTFPSSEYFSTLSSSIYYFTTMLDGDNFPHVMMDDYTQNKAVFLFYFLYLMIGIYIIMGLFLAVFYHSFYTINQEQRRESADREFKYINACWHTLTAHEAEPDKASLNKRTLLNFFNSLRSEKYATNALKLKKFPDARNDEIVYRILDRDDDGRIDKEEFERFCILIKMVNELPDLEGSDKIAKYDRCLGCIKGFLDNGWIEFFYLLLTIGNLGALYYASEIQNWDADRIYWWIVLQLVVSCFYIFEIVLALLAGAQQFLNSLHHVVETLMSLTSIFLVLHDIFYWNRSSYDNTQSSARNIVAYFVLIRMFRVFRLLLKIEEWNLLFRCIGKLAPQVFSFFIGMFAIFYIFALSGSLFFGGKIFFDGANFLGSTDSNIVGLGEQFGLYNFNDFSNAIVAIAIFLFSPWYGIVAVVEAAVGVGSRWYFVVLYFSTVLLIVNIVIPIVFGVFDFEYKQHKELKRAREEYPDSEKLEFHGKGCHFNEKEFEIIVEREFLRRKGLA